MQHVVNVVQVMHVWLTLEQIMAASECSYSTRALGPFHKATLGHRTTHLCFRQSWVWLPANPVLAWVLQVEHILLKHHQVVGGGKSCILLFPTWDISWAMTGQTLLNGVLVEVLEVGVLHV